MLAGVGLDFGAVMGGGHLAHFEDSEFASQLQNLDKRLLKEGLVFPAKGADGIVVGMGVGAEETHRQVLVTGAFDLSRTESAGGKL